MFSEIFSVVGKLVDFFHGQSERTRNAAIALSETTWDFQRAVWLFVSVQPTYGVAHLAREVAEENKKATEKIDSAYRGFTQDYDWPTKLSPVVKKQIETIDREIANLKAFSMTRQEDELTKAAQEIQTACEKIREAAKPYAYRFWRRYQEQPTAG